MYGLGISWSLLQILEKIVKWFYISYEQTRKNVYESLKL